VATNKHATIEEPVPKKRNGEHAIIRVLLKTVVSVRSLQNVYKEELSFETPACQDMSLGAEELN
jgi:hypothetical protein